MKKPLHVKPNFYSYCLEPMKIIAKEFGYNLLVHGSLNRDMDLIAVPWSDTPKDELNLIKALNMYLGDAHMMTKEDYCHSVLPGGRSSYVINLNRSSKWNNFNDAEYYFDISITPLVVSKK